MKYYTIHEVTEILGVSAQTLRNWDKSGKLKPHHKSANGYRYYTQDDLNMLLGVKSQTGKTVGYCRVSSPKQKEDLKRQEENMRIYLLAQGRPFEIISIQGVANLERNQAGISASFMFSGNIMTIMDRLHQLKLEDIFIEEPSLEEIFLHYYE